ncbi:MAG TPA: transposase [Verrucomicrobiae bacterium]|nr:transposase [Verrucomicrobiae bacterium]
MNARSQKDSKGTTTIESVAPLRDAAWAAGGNHPISEFHFTRRRLPHRQTPGEVYFVTFRPRQARVLHPHERNIALSACRFWDGKKIELYAVVIMPNQVHLLLQPRPAENDSSGVYNLAEVLRSIKSFSAHKISKSSGIKGAVWQHESYDRIVRDKAEFDEQWRYICSNAVKKELAREPDEYPWLWYQGIEDATTTSETLAPPGLEMSKS